MTDSVVVRKPLRSEIPQLAELGSRLFVQTFDGLYSDEDLQAFLNQVHSPAGVAYDWDAGCEFWIAERIAEAGTFIGYCKAGPVKVPYDVGDRRVLELRQLYVDQPFHRGGVGSMFMREFLQLCEEREVQDAYVSCWSENQKALAFYARFGFEQVGEYAFMVGNHRDHELILRKQV